MYIHVPIYVYIYICGDLIYVYMHDFPKAKNTMATKGHTDINIHVHVHVSEHLLMYTCLLALLLLFSSSSSELRMAVHFDGLCVLTS